MIRLSNLNVTVPPGFISEIDPPTEIAVDVRSTEPRASPAQPAAAVVFVPTEPAIDAVAVGAVPGLNNVGEGQDYTVVLTR